ncbi:MAG: Lrp/AsnC ligand binding domain-containing protein [Desulfobacterales bacterium]|nr:MAG: Lrp/AsnC ligand binding domain-containing protein [Desulfobacterales bacterium]
MGITFWKSKSASKPNNRANGRRQENESSEVKSFRDQQQKEAAFDHRDRGIRTVPLDRIVGSVGRYKDFDSRFRFKSTVPSDRLEWIKTAMREGRSLGPVKLFEIKDEFYVLDGNHRIAAAKALGHDEILAHIEEFIPSKNTLQNILYRERAEFADRTRLPAEINLTEVNQYAYLLEQISEHRQFLQEAEADEVTFEKAALDWFKTIYRPLCTIIKRSRLVDSFPERTIDDLYAYITFHQWKEGRKRQYGIGVDKLVPKNMEEFRKKMTELKEAEYPEMKQGINVFILMNVQAKKEIKLMDKLFELEEVKEVHSVHGDVDLVVKVVLTRDLLSSDAEIISQFVHEKVRQLPGVVSTKTLIPGVSKIKVPEVCQEYVNNKANGE